MVRKIAGEHGIDLTDRGQRRRGRVTKKDILDSRSRAPSGKAAPAALPAAGRPRAPSRVPAPAARGRLEAPRFRPARRVEREQMTLMRKRIAEHMIESAATSAHVHSVFEIDVTRMMTLRQRNRRLRGAPGSS